MGFRGFKNRAESVSRDEQKCAEALRERVLAIKQSISILRSFHLLQKMLFTCTNATLSYRSAPPSQIFLKISALFKLLTTWQCYGNRTFS